MFFREYVKRQIGDVSCSMASSVNVKWLRNIPLLLIPSDQCWSNNVHNVFPKIGVLFLTYARLFWLLEWKRLKFSRIWFLTESKRATCFNRSKPRKIFGQNRRPNGKLLGWRLAQKCWRYITFRPNDAPRDIIFVSLSFNLFRLRKVDKIFISGINRRFSKPHWAQKHCVMISKSYLEENWKVLNDSKVRLLRWKLTPPQFSCPHKSTLNPLAKRLWWRNSDNFQENDPFSETFYQSNRRAKKWLMESWIRWFWEKPITWIFRRQNGWCNLWLFVWFLEGLLTQLFNDAVSELCKNIFGQLILKNMSSVYQIMKGSICNSLRFTKYF